MKYKEDQLNEANSKIEEERTELSNLEVVRKDLEAQRSFFTRELQDSDIKGKYPLHFSFILDLTQVENFNNRV
jgi:hypothetical protein